MKRKCIYFERVKYDICKECSGDDVDCLHYISERPIEYNPILLREERKIKILPRNYQDWIRRNNDSGVI